MLATLILALLAAVQSSEPSRDWQAVGESNAGSLMAFDRASLRLDRATMIATLDYRLVRADSVRIARLEVRCSERTTRVVQTLTYSATGALLGRDELPSEWNPIPPENSFAAVADEACGTAPRPG